MCTYPCTPRERCPLGGNSSVRYHLVSSVQARFSPFCPLCSELLTQPYVAAGSLVLVTEIRNPVEKYRFCRVRGAQFWKVETEEPMTHTGRTVQDVFGIGAWGLVYACENRKSLVRNC